MTYQDRHRIFEFSVRDWRMVTTKEGGPLKQPSDSDWPVRETRHPVNDFKPEAATRNEANSIDLTYHRTERRFGLSAKGPLAMAALVAISVAFMLFVFYWKGR